MRMQASELGMGDPANPAVLIGLAHEESPSLLDFARNTSTDMALPE